MTWFVTENGYELFFNRDERLSRSRAGLPQIKLENSCKYISPTDADAGGTWIAVNQYGVTVCLLNYYEFEQIKTYKDWVSRGEIVRQFACSQDPNQAERQFMELELSDYRAFRMFVIEPSGKNCLCVWDGHRPRVERDVSTPKSSSSVDAKHVKSLRKELFRDLGLARSKESHEFLAYHASHSPSRSKESVCMHRDDAKTVSLSHIVVDDLDVSFAYADGSPCEAELGAPVRLDIAMIQDQRRELKLATQS